MAKARELQARYWPCTLISVPPGKTYYNPLLEKELPGDPYMSVKCSGMNSAIKLNIPGPLKDLTLIYADSTDVILYKYSDSEYDLGIRDDIREKRYVTTVWELP